MKVSDFCSGVTKRKTTVFPCKSVPYNSFSKTIFQKCLLSITVFPNFITVNLYLQLLAIQINSVLHFASIQAFRTALSQYVFIRYLLHCKLSKVACVMVCVSYAFKDEDL